MLNSRRYEFFHSYGTWQLLLIITISTSSSFSIIIWKESILSNIITIFCLTEIFRKKTVYANKILVNLFSLKLKAICSWMGWHTSTILALERLGQGGELQVSLDYTVRPYLYVN